MQKFAEEEQFELALDYRNKIQTLKRLSTRRITSMPRDVDADVWAMASNGLYAAVSVLVTRKGVMQGARTFSLEEGANERSEAFTSILTQYYTSHEIPHELILEEETDDGVLTQYAKEKSGHGVGITRPKMGVKRELLDMAAGNAREYLEKSISAIEHRSDMTVNACRRLQQLLGLAAYPKRAECYDISNISGVDKVGSMVVFTDGEADKYEYRRFKIKTVEGADDFASLQEVLKRRLSKLGTEDEDKFPKPQLIVIDGGKGQLSAVREIFDEMKITGIDLKLLQRLRDEAHRFAITYFRNLHSKRNLQSVLDEIEGIGKSKRIALMEKFGTIDRIMKASEEELASAEGIGKELAGRIKRHFEEL